MLDDFLFRAFLGGLGVALVAGPLGCFVVWRRMAYFGASIAHAALLGVALGLFIEVDPLLGIFLVSVLFAFAIVGMEHLTRLASDTLLGILAHLALALGVIALAIMNNPGIDLMGYLFGDILAVTRLDLAWIYVGGGAALALLAVIWRPLLAMTVDEDMARAEGVATRRTRLLFTLLLALVIAIAMKIVGVLLIVSLLIVPAAAARALARSPEQMALAAAFIGVAAVAGGLLASLQWDAPSGPAIVVAAFLLFLLSRLARRDRSAR
jgi:zinc transport system permease protein